jgi:DNA repair protein RecO (recombination protein O)
MNHFSDQGIIISVRGHGESGGVVQVLSENHGKCGGYANGAQSSGRLRSALQQGNHVTFDWQSKSEGQLGRFDLELDRDITVSIMDDSRALMAVQSACGLIDMFVPDRENYESLYHGTSAFMDIVKTDSWPAIYITWEMAFLREMGYGIDISKCTVTGATENLTHISPKSGRAVCEAEAKPYAHKLLEIPKFLQGQGIEQGDIAKGLKMTGYFMMHRLLQHSTYHKLPDCRSQLEQAFEGE